MPDAVPVVPTGPDDGSRTTVGGRTVNEAEAKSFAGDPVAVIVYVPAGTLTTLKLAVATPPYVGLGVIEQEESVLTGEPDSVQLVSLSENPDP